MIARRAQCGYFIYLAKIEIFNRSEEKFFDCIARLAKISINKNRYSNVIRAYQL